MNYLLGRWQIVDYRVAPYPGFAVWTKPPTHIDKSGSWTVRYQSSALIVATSSQNGKQVDCFFIHESLVERLRER